MECQASLLLELLDPNTTPEKALQSLSDPCLSPALFNGEDEESVVIFLAYIRFIITRLPDACVDGIWVDIMWKALKYCRNFYRCNGCFSFTRRSALESFGCGARELFLEENYNRFVPTESLQVSKWLIEALSTRSKCPNPYMRLELFRLIRLFGMFSLMSHESISVMFIHTLCDIEPHCLYPSGNADDVLFSAVDLNQIISSCSEELIQITSTDINNQLKEKNEVTNKSDVRMFLVNCIQMIGVFAVMAGSNPDWRIKFIELKYCCTVFYKGMGRLMKCPDNLTGMSPLMLLQYVITDHPSYGSYTIETVRDLTAAIGNYKPGNVKQLLMSLRDIIAKELGVCHDICTLPTLLLSRQIQGPKLVRQHSLLLRELGDVYEEHEELFSDSWSQIMRQLEFCDGDSSSSDNDSEISSSDYV